jgi:hypothetical protein
MPCAQRAPARAVAPPTGPASPPGISACQSIGRLAQNYGESAEHAGVERTAVNTQTAQVALSSLRAGYVQDYSLSLTGTLLATVPLILVFGLLSKQIIGGIMQGAVKG